MNKRGLTLAEMIFAIGIASVAILAAVALQTYSTRAMNQSSTQYQASLVASSLMAETRQSLKADFATDVTQERAAVPPALQSAGDRFEYEVVEVGVVLNDEGEPILKELRLTVFWEQRGDKSYDLWTKVAAP